MTLRLNCLQAPVALGLATYLLSAKWSAQRTRQALLVFAAASPVVAALTYLAIVAAPGLSSQVRVLEDFVAAHIMPGAREANVQVPPVRCITCIASAFPQMLTCLAGLHCAVCPLLWRSVPLCPFTFCLHRHLCCLDALQKCLTLQMLYSVNSDHVCFFVISCHGACSVTLLCREKCSDLRIQQT